VGGEVEGEDDLDDYDELNERPWHRGIKEVCTTLSNSYR